MDLSHLNPSQRRAVETLDGPVLLLAGAGTGKTRVVTCRVAKLVETGVDPAHILAVTFTNKAAGEMLERIGTLVDPEATQRLTVCTFHALGMKILRRHIGRLGYTSDFGIAADAYQVGLIRTILGELGYAFSKEDEVRGNYAGSPRDCLNAIQNAKAALRTPRDVAAQGGARDEPLAEVYRRYTERMKQMNLLDFSDLLGLTIRLWETHSDLLELYRDTFRYIMVDEYQDTNAVQLRMVAMLAGEHRNLCVVGDDDQSIYGWRGADVSNILDFAEHFPGATVIRLEQNYRSTNKILRAANCVIARNQQRHDKNLWSDRGDGENLLSVVTDDEEGEARLVAELIQERKAEGRRYGDCAVLYRSNGQSQAIEHALRHARIPHKLVGHRSFFERREILDAVAILKSILNPRDDLSLLQILNVPPRGIGDASVRRLRELQHIARRPLQDLLGDPECLGEMPAEAARSMRDFHQFLLDYRDRFASTSAGFASVIREALAECGYLDGLVRMYKPRADAIKRREFVDEFVANAHTFADRNGRDANLATFLDSISLRDTNDREDSDAEDADDQVTLLTVHAAKGLEFPIVFLVGLEHDLFPHRNALADRSLEEERRLFYVALTRAQNEILLLHARKRRVRGSRVPRRPSPFLDDLPLDHLEIHDGESVLKPLGYEETGSMIEQLKKQLRGE